MPLPQDEVGFPISADITLDATDLAAILAQMAGGLNTAIPASNTANSANDMLLDQIPAAIAAIPTTAMRGTDSAALASVLGALNTAAATGAVTDTDEAMAYIKELVTELQVVDGIVDAIKTVTDAALDAAAIQAACLAALTSMYGGTKRFATKTSSNPLTSGNLFAFSGTVMILSIIGRVTATHPAAANTCKLTITPDALAGTDICATKDLTGLDAGTILSITGTLSDNMVATDGVGVAIAQATPVVVTCVTSGVITVTYGDSGNQASAITWEIVWVPMNTDGDIDAA